MEAEGDAADQALLAIGEGLEGSAGCLAKADAHDAERLRRRQDGGIVRPGMVAMAMGDDGALDGAGGIDEEIAGGAIEPLRTRKQPGRGMGRRHRSFSRRQFRSRGISSSKSRANTSASPS